MPEERNFKSLRFEKQKCRKTFPIFGNEMDYWEQSSMRTFRAEGRIYRPKSGSQY
jgi:hypothetical protein